jgi:hypothetical protein
MESLRCTLHISAPTPLSCKIQSLTETNSTLAARAPFPGLSAFLNFQSIGCGDPIDLIMPNLDVGACLSAVRGGLTWLIRSGDMVWQGQGPPPTQCRIRFFQERGCTGFSTVGELNICRNNQPSGFWSFRVTC